jgi:CCR4-NOT transcription complex subunit 7/8
VCRYLLKLMTGDKLPPSETQFNELLKLYFPRVWDMKYIMSKKNLHGGLSKVCPALMRISQVHHNNHKCVKTICWG